MRFAPFALAILLSGCATIIHGSNQEIAFSSNPSASQVMIDGQMMGETPVTLALSRKERHTVRFDLDGYQPYEMQLSRSVDGWIAGNIIFGGLIGLVVDAATGAMYKLSPEQVQADLMTAGTASIDASGDHLHIAVVLTPSSEWEQIGTLTPMP